MLFLTPMLTLVNTISQTSPMSGAMGMNHDCWSVSTVLQAAVVVLTQQECDAKETLFQVV